MLYLLGDRDGVWLRQVTHAVDYLWIWILLEPLLSERIILAAIANLVGDVMIWNIFLDHGCILFFRFLFLFPELSGLT